MIFNDGFWNMNDGKGLRRKPQALFLFPFPYRDRNLPSFHPPNL